MKVGIYILCVTKHLTTYNGAVFSVRRIVIRGKWKSLTYIHYGIDSKASKSLVKPPVNHFVDFITKLRVLPV